MAKKKAADAATAEAPARKRPIIPGVTTPKVAGAFGRGSTIAEAVNAAADQVNAQLQEEAPKSPLYTNGLPLTVPISSIKVVRNTRKHFDQAGLDELARTIQEMGILQPLVVRAPLIAAMEPLSSETVFADDCFDLVAGERRLRAAKLAGLTHVPVMARILTDRQFLEVQVLENLQRVDINPADEAEGLAELRAKGFSIEELAHRLGRTEAFIAQRVAIANLLPELLEALRNDLLHIGAAIVLARLPREIQESIYVDVKARFARRETYTKQLAEYDANRFMRRLVDAKFNIEQVNLVADAGACTSCQYNSATQQTLFPEDTNLHAGRCLKGTCWTLKTETAFLLKKQELEETLGQPIRMLSGAYGTKQAPDHVDYMDWHQSTEGAVGAVQAMIANGPMQGEIKWVKITDRDPDAAIKRQQEETLRQNARREELAQISRLNTVALDVLLHAFFEDPAGEMATDVLRCRVLMEIQNSGVLHEDEVALDAFVLEKIGLDLRMPDRDDPGYAEFNWDNHVIAQLNALGPVALVRLLALWPAIVDRFSSYPDDALKIYQRCSGADIAALQEKAATVKPVLEEAAADA